MFNYIEFFEDEGIDYEPSNKAGWTHIECPFCDDTGKHLGLNNRSVSCFKCGTHILPNLIKELTNLNPYPIMKKYNGKEDNDEKIYKKSNKKNDKEEKEVCLPVETNSTLNRESRNYLVDRRFDPRILQNDWEIGACIGVGEYKFRIIIPIYSESRLVSFQGRDYTGKQKNKYETCKGTSLKDYLYGMDYVKKNSKIIVVEGVPGVWRLGKGNAIATFGITYTQQQVKKILLGQFKKVGVLFDIEPQAKKQAELLTGSLSMIGVNAVKLNLPKGRKDPDELTKKEIKDILNF